MYEMREELENLAFRELNPEAYKVMRNITLTGISLGETLRRGS